MRSTKWDEYIDLDLDDDLSDPDRIQTLLSKQDPQRLDTKLQSLTVSALRTLHELIEQQPSKTSSNPTFLLRTIREIDARRRHLLPRVPSLSSLTFSAPFLTSLHTSLATSLFTTTTSSDILSLLPIASASNIKPAYIALWDAGTPPLPVQPSPAVFKFLTTLHRGMDGVGADVWTREAVGELRRVARVRVAERILEESGEKTEAEEQGKPVNGKKEDAEEEKDGEEAGDAVKENGDKLESEQSGAARRDAAIQRTFDAAYLQQVFAGSTEKDVDELAKAVETLEVRIGEQKGEDEAEGAELDQAAKARLRKSAGEYWKRTYLLFGLLAPGR